MLKIKKLRIFKRLREYKAEIANLLRVTGRLEKVADKLIGKVVELKNKIVDLVNTTKELTKRRDEFLNRIGAKIPDDIMSESFENYKYWLSEPFIIDKYKPYSEPKSNEAFVDRLSAIRGMGKVLDEVEKRDENIE